MKNKSEFFQSCWEQAYNARQSKDLEWYIYSEFYRGNQYLTVKNGNVIRPKTDKIVINKIYTTVRGVRNYVLRNRPKWSVFPINPDDANVSDAVNTNKYLDFKFDQLRMKPKLREIVGHGLIKSIAPVQIIWNPSLEEGAGDIELNTIDPFDFYPDPKAKNLEKAQYIIIAVRKNIEELKKNKSYNQKIVENLSPDDNLSTSTFKEMLENKSTTGNKENGAVLLKEVWYLKDNEVWVATIANDNYEEPLRNELTEYTHLPFRVFHSDIQAGSFYGFGWVKNLIPIQKALNKLSQNQLDYNNLMNKGSWIVPAKAGVISITNEEGKFIKYKGNIPPSQAAIAPLTNNVVVQERNMNSYIEDIGALQEATRGRLPSAGTSGKALEVLQIGDANNMSELVENLESFLEYVCADILELTSRHYDFARTIQPLEESGSRSFIKVIGSNGEKVEGATVIPEKNIVDVKISSFLSDTQEGRQEVVKELAQLGVLPVETVLETYNFSNIPDIVQKLKKQKVEEAQLEVNKKEAEAQAQAQAQPQTPAQQPAGALSASAAVKAILQGQNPQIPESPSVNHLNQLDSYLAKAQEAGITQSVLAQIEGYRNQVAQLIG